MSEEKYIDGRDMNKGNVKKCTKKNNDGQQNINKIYFVVKKKILKKKSYIKHKLRKKIFN